MVCSFFLVGSEAYHDVSHLLLLNLSGSELYYWANIIVNPILILLLFVKDFQEQAAVIAAIWMFISGLINPRAREYALTLFGEGLGSLFAILVNSCWVILFGGIGAILFLAFVVGLTILCFVFMIAIGLVFLWIDALFAIKRSSGMTP